MSIYFSDYCAAYWAVITRLHATKANPAHVMQIAGHADEAKGVHFKTYTHDVGLQALADTLGGLRYALDFQTLRIEDPRFSKTLHRWNMQEQRKENTPTKNGRRKNLSS